MFKDFYISHVVDYCYEVRIIDDDFETKIKIDPVGVLGCRVPTRYLSSDATEVDIVAQAIIKVYTARQLDVVHNLALLILLIHEKYPEWSLVEIMVSINTNIPRQFDQYFSQIEKLLVFN